MALQYFSPQILYPFNNYVPGTLPATGALLIDDSSEKVAFIGPVLWPDISVTSRAITKIGFRSSGTKTGGSGIRLSLQDVSTATLMPYQPDGTQDQYVDIPASGWSTSGMQMSPALSANRTVNWGEMVAVVVEFDSGGRLGADTFALTGSSSGTQYFDNSEGYVHYSGGVWATASGTACPNFVAEFADGTFGSIGSPDAIMHQLSTTGTFNSGSATFDEYAIRFTLPFGVQIHGLWPWVGPAATSSDFDAILYDSSNNVLASKSMDANLARALATRGYACYFSSPVELAANTQYYASIKPTTTNNISMNYYDVLSASHLNAIFGHQNWCLATRVDGAGSWTINTTRRPMGGLIISGFHDGVGGGGGLKSNPGMRGGFL
jgi:hypothetical protein